MKYYFPHLSPPYSGQNKLELPLTLNSKILSKIAAEKKMGISSGIFPQRVPRIGFFEELDDQEINGFKEQAVIFRSQIANELADKQLPIGELINRAEYAIRIGLTEEIIELKDRFVTEAMPAKLAVLIDAAETRKALHLDSNQSCPDLVKLYQSPNLSLEDSALIANRILVKHYRYIRGQALENENRYVGTVKQAIEVNSRDGIGQLYRKAMLCRGVAMSRLIPKEESQELVETSLKFVSKIEPTNETQLLLKQELLLTTLLTKAKTSGIFGRTDESEEILLDLTKIDPLDSVTWSEVGLAEYKKNSWESAKELFEKAYHMGPPARALNAFYAGNSARNLDQFDEALIWWKNSSACDSTAVSPLYESAMLLHKINRKAEAREMAQIILNNPEMLELLDLEEVVCLKDL